MTPADDLLYRPETTDRHLETAPMREHPTLSLRIHLGESDMFGPGKAELLERISKTGSIAAAAREIGMSYKRAWMLIETLNAMFDTPLVVSTRGGAGRGGASLTERGRSVLSEYRAIECDARSTAHQRLQRLQNWLRHRVDPSDRGT